MDDKILENIAEFICGNSDSNPQKKFPTYRTGGDLPRFFQRCGLNQDSHCGTRKWWTLEVLQQLNEEQLKTVLMRLANPKEYDGDLTKTQQAIVDLNKIIKLENLEIELINGNVEIKEKNFDNYTIKNQPNENGIPSEPMKSPTFFNALEKNLRDILISRWSETQICINNKAYLAAMILMGSIIEALLLALIEKNPEKANRSKSAPKNSEEKIKKFQDWTLNDMINVAHIEGFLKYDVSKFSHAVREYRNLVHPYQQRLCNTTPNKDTTDISWCVITAACNQLSPHFSQGNI